MKYRCLLMIYITGACIYLDCGPAAAFQAVVPKTGQTLSSGHPWPAIRFTTNGNGTVTDNLTGLIWLRDANCTETAGGIDKTGGSLVWADALAWSNGLASGKCGLSDGSSSSDWRLPNINELKSLIDFSSYNPPLPNEHPFTAVQSADYWSSSTVAITDLTTMVWDVSMETGLTLDGETYKTSNKYAWPVRGGQFGNSIISVLPASGGYYGYVPVGDVSSQNVTIRNAATTGASRLQINAIDLRDNDRGQFSINPGNGSGGSCGALPILNPGASCTLAVGFTPNGKGGKSATLRVSGSDVNAPNTDIPLFGFGAYTVTAGVSGGNGAISSTNPAILAWGDSVSFTLAPAATYKPASSVTGSCPAGSWNGNEYTTGTVTADCTVGFSFTRITYPLTITFAGSGAGTVTALPKPPAIDCSGSCSQSFETGTVVTLTPAPDGASVFSSWNGCDSIAGNQCTVNMSSARGVSVYLNATPLSGAKVTSNYYATVGGAYGSVTSDGEISLKNIDFYEVLNFNRAVGFNLRGGYSGDFLSRSGVTTIHGSITISAGTVTFDNIVLQGE